ncbi:MAG: acyl-CoA dehydrogenase family protein [Thermodesulfobacteriota bacterium]|nr:acyl-CoA dehydrogenase family protein [Thermodesulfobacteriota bacterium]
MDFTIPYELRDLVSSLKKFINNEIKPLQESHQDENGCIPEEIRKKVRLRSRELGFYGADFPEECGGGGLSNLGMTLLREEIGRSGLELADSIFGEAGAMSQILLECNGEQKERYLLPAIRAEKLSCFALTEPNAGSDAAAIETKAQKEGDEFILNGRKHFISNGPYADFAIVFAVTDRELRAKGGITCFLVDRDTRGFSLGRIQQHMGGGDRLGELIFEDCRVPARNVLGKVGAGFLLAMKRVGEGRLRLTALFMGMADKCLQLALDYAKQRVQFGKPIARYQAIQWMLVDMSVEIHASRLMLYHAAWKADQGMDIIRESGMAKLYSSEMLCRAADKALQIHGGMGYMKECPIEGIYRKARASRIGEGTSEIQRILLARKLLQDGPLRFF